METHTPGQETVDAASQKTADTARQARHNPFSDPAWQDRVAQIFKEVADDPDARGAIFI